MADSFIINAELILEATPSRRDDMRKKLVASFFFLIALSAWILAMSGRFSSIAFFNLARYLSVRVCQWWDWIDCEAGEKIRRRSCTMINVADCRLAVVGTDGVHPRSARRRLQDDKRRETFRRDTRWAPLHLPFLFLFCFLREATKLFGCKLQPRACNHE